LSQYESRDIVDAAARATTVVAESTAESLGAGEDARIAGRAVRIRGMVSFY
jgi:hypothetical protein